MNVRVLSSRMALIVLALVGLFDAAFLARERARQIASAVCVFENACEQLQMSEWSTIPRGTGIPVAVVGIVGFGTMIAVAALALARERVGPLSLSVALFAVSSIAVACAVYLLVVQIYATGGVCARSLPSALVSLGLWLAALVGLRARPPAAGVITTVSPLPAAGWVEQGDR